MQIQVQIHVQIWRMRKQWIPGPFLSPREKGLGTRLPISMPARCVMNRMMTVGVVIDSIIYGVVNYTGSLLLNS